MVEYYKTKWWPSEDGELFDRAQVYSTTPGHNGWTIDDESSSGTPTYLNISGGGAKLTLVNTNEAEIVTLYHGDVLAFDIDEIQQVEFKAVVAGIEAVTTLVMGVGGARDDVADNVAQHAWFRMEGSASTTAVVVETDDGTNDNNDVATAETLAATTKKFRIDFSYGKSDVRFYIDDKRVASSTTFDMSNYAGNLQPFFMIQKASGTGVPSVTIKQFRLLYGKVFD